MTNKETLQNYNTNLNGNNISLEDILNQINNLPSRVTSNVLSGKKVSIIGDSISTYSGHIPSGYATFYPSGDITSVDKTWWYQLIQETNMTLVTNASWSGSYVTGDSTSTTNAVAACSTARINALKNGTTTPDIILVYIGINDFAQEVHRQLGDYTGKTEVPSEGTILTFSEAYGLMISKILAAYPNARVFCCTLLETSNTSFNTSEDGVYPAINRNGVPLGDFNERIKTIATNMGVGIIDLHACGITYWNLNTTTTDLLHPNAKGAVLVKNFIRNSLINQLK